MTTDKNRRKRGIHGVSGGPVRRVRQRAPGGAWAALRGTETAHRVDPQHREDDPKKNREHVVALSQGRQPEQDEQREIQGAQQDPEDLGASFQMSTSLHPARRRTDCRIRWPPLDRRPQGSEQRAPVDPSTYATCGGGERCGEGTTGCSSWLHRPSRASAPNDPGEPPDHRTAPGLGPPLSPSPCRRLARAHARRA